MGTDADGHGVCKYCTSPKTACQFGVWLMFVLGAEIGGVLTWLVVR